MDDEQVRELRAALSLVQRRLRRDVLSRHDLSRPALQVLGVLSRTAGTTPGGLAAELRMATSNVATALRELESAGHIRRSPDPEDGRRTRVELTDAGVRALHEIRAERDTWLGRAIATELDAAEQDLLVRAGRLLARLAAHDEADAG